MEIGLKEKGNINSIKVLPREAAYQPASFREVLGEVRAAALQSGSGLDTFTAKTGASL